jgi:hypothetical protein
VGDLGSEFPLAHPQVRPGDDGLFHTPTGWAGHKGVPFEAGSTGH